jgi:hypothetical protein
MKRLLTVTVAVLLMAAVAAPALAWEFAMTGQWEYRMRYFARTGDIDLFGNAGLQNAWPAGVSPTLVGFAGPRIYNRGTATVAPAYPAVGAFYADQSNPVYRIVKGGYSRSESDAFYSDSRLTFNPEIRVNPAIRVHGVYNIGGMRHKYFQAFDGPTNIGVAPFERYYMSQTSMNAYDTAAIGSWEQFRATIQTPIAIFSLGVKDFPFGTGASLGYNTRAEAFLTVVPYGPFRFLHGLWLSRGLLGTQESWATTPDSQSRNTLFQGILATYDSGPLAIGAGAIWRQTHVNADELGPATAAVYAAFDVNTLIYVGFMKYNNGRVFTNAEYAWATVDFYRPRFAPPGGVPLAVVSGPRYDECYHWWWEVGAFAGPAKVSLLYAIASGPVQNLSYTQGGVNTGNTTKVYRPWAINYQAMEPYEFLMFNTYGGGNAGGWSALDVTFVNDDHGMMTDAFCFAGRVDYAVASNLNVFGSYIWAHRLEKAGTWKGQFLATGADATAAQRQAFVLANFGAASGETAGGTINPFVDDGHIGWEVNLGMAWKLLEGLNLNAKYSYWQPGKYFDQAIQGVGMTPLGVRADNAVVQGKSAIQAITGSMVIDF